VALAALLSPAALLGGAVARAQPFGDVQRVELAGYSGDAMEPFLTRDGRFLLFNDSNAPGNDTDLHYAERVDGLTFEYRGEIVGANSTALDAVASVDAFGAFFFVSLRSYPVTLASIHRGLFLDGAVEGVTLVSGLSRGVPGWVNFDAEIAWDGGEIYFVDGEVTGTPPPASADLAVAEIDGASALRRPESDSWLAAVNSGALEYAPALSADRLELFFTRYLEGSVPRILRASRSGIAEPFGEPVELTELAGFVEAPTLSADALALYFHRLDADGFHVYRATRGTRPILFADSFEAGFARWGGATASRR